jgi:two-component system, OmpR family, phosphate regulon sensor histidine kinase PhoR
MQNYTPLRLSLIAASLVVAAFVAVFVFSSLYFYGYLAWKPLLLGTGCLFVFTYFLFKLVLEKFIYEKIRLIYKTIHDQKVPKGQQLKVPNDDILNRTNQEVIAWARDRKKEIEDLRKLEAYRREYLGNVSHELKTPIFNIQGYVLTLLDGALDDPEINRKYLLRAEQSINRMISIVEDLEVISRFESGELKLNMENFDIAGLARDVMEFLEIEAGKKGIRLHFGRAYDSPLPVNADRERIRQVLTNLVVNSIKYGTENGRTKISFFDMDEHILVEVTDSGIGIPREELPRVFERFYRGDKSRSRKVGEGGSGLGLAIVKHIIEAHAQTINVRSTLGVGTTFAFTLKKGIKSA